MATLVTFDEFTSGARPQDGTIKEVVLEEVTNLISKERPLMSMIGRQGVTNTFVEQLTDTLGSRGVNAQLEGVAFQDTTLAQPTRHFVHVQSFGKWGRVSDENRLVGHYNGDPFTYQVSKAVDELMNDIEHALHRGSAATGETDVARQLNGLLNIFSGQSGTATYTSSSGTTLTEEIFIDLLQVFRDERLGVRPSQCYVNSLLKRTVSEYSTKITRNVDAAAKLQMLVVERHSSDFGDLDILYTEDQLKAASKITYGNSLAFVDPQYFKAGWLRPPTVEQLSRDGFRDRFQINAQATLLYDHEKGGGGGDGFVSYINQA
jgi:hypothetical protein